MNEVICEVKTYKIDVYCSQCGEKLKRLDTVLTTYPAKYQYICDNCGKEYISDKCYPYIRYEEVYK